MKNKKLKELYDNRNDLIEEQKNNKILLKYVTRKLNICFYIIFMTINIYIFKISIIPSILLGAFLSFIPTISIRYKLSKVLDTKYKKEEDKINILIHLHENKTNKDTQPRENEKKIEYNYKYNPNSQKRTEQETTPTKQNIKSKQLIIDTSTKKD